MTLRTTTRPVIIFLVVLLITTIHLRAESNQAIVPLNITVHGKLIITDAESDNARQLNPNLNVYLRLRKNARAYTSGRKAIRIRTNLNSWKLTAQRINLPNAHKKINPKNIQVAFTTQSGAKANPRAARLIAPFNKTTNLSQISNIIPTGILFGNMKTSIAKDPGNRNNWFQLTSNYSVSPESFKGTGEWETVISYNLVSP